MKNWKQLTVMATIAIITLAFVFIACDDGNKDDQQQQGTWEQANIEPITGTISGTAISFTYDGSPVTLNKEGGGDSLDGVWNGIFNGDTIKVTVTGNNWTMAVLDNGSYVETAKGTIAVSGTNVTITVTHTMSNGGNVNLPPQPPPMQSYNGTWTKGTDQIVLIGIDYTFKQVMGGTLYDVSHGTFTANLAVSSGSFFINQTHQINTDTGQLEDNPQTETGTFSGAGVGATSFTLAGFSYFPVNGTWTKQ